MGVNKEHAEFQVIDMNGGWDTPAGYPTGFQQKILSGALDEANKHGTRGDFTVAKPAVPGLRLIGDLPPPGGGAKAEGVGVIKEEDHHWEILVVFDGLDDGHATRFRVDRP